MDSNAVLFVCLAVVVGILIWDLYLATDEREGNTITQSVKRIIEIHPMIPFTMGLTLGIFVGHLFW